MKDHGSWMEETASKLAVCGLDYDDSYQTLAVYLLEGDTRWYAWMRTFRDLSYDRHKHSAAPLEYTQAEASGVTDPENLPLAWREEIEHRLTPRERDTLMEHLAGYTQEEIASKAGCTRQAISLRIDSALTKLRECD